MALEGDGMASIKVLSGTQASRECMDWGSGSVAAGGNGLSSADMSATF